MAPTNQLAYIETPAPTGDPVKSLIEFLTASGTGHERTVR